MIIRQRYFAFMHFLDQFRPNPIKMVKIFQSYSNFFLSMDFKGSKLKIEELYFWRSSTPILSCEQIVFSGWWKRMLFSKV